MKEMSKLSKFGRIIMVLTMVLSVGLSLFNNPLSADAAETGSVTIHKKKFENGSFTSKQNTGDIMDAFDGLQNLDGANFAIVPVSKAEWQAAKALSDQQTEALRLYNLHQADAQTGTTSGGGLLTFSGLTLNQIYLIVELAPYPDGIDVPAAPMYVSLPYAVLDADGKPTDEILNDIHLYPKNEYIKGNIELIKLDQNLKDPVVGAKFRLYDADGVEMPNVEADGITLIDDGRYTTDTDGKIIFNNILTGTYELREVEAAPGYNISNEASSHTFTVTYEDLNNSTKTKTITLTNPKKTIKTPEFPSYDAGAIVKWTATQPVPGDIGTYDVFAFHDELDSRLGYVTTPATVLTVEGGAAAETLTPGTDYTIDTTTTPGTVSFIFTPDGKAKLQTYVDNLTGAQTAEVKMVFHTELLVDVPSTIPNTMDYEFDNTGTPETKPGTPTKVETGGRKFVKVDSSKTGNDKFLEGAQFKVYKMDGSNKLWYKAETVAGNLVVTWVANEADGTVLESDTDGTFQVEGVAYGTYFLKETKAPEGYGLLATDYEFTVSENSFGTATPIEIENSEAPELPVTGGMGTVIFAMIGIMLMGGAYMFYRKSKTA